MTATLQPAINEIAAMIKIDKYHSQGPVWHISTLLVKFILFSSTSRFVVELDQNYFGKFFCMKPIGVPHPGDPSVMPKPKKGHRPRTPRSAW
jgi:hypothetical protein